MPWEHVVDVVKLLSAPGRDFLVRGNGDKVPVSELKGKVVGLYFYIGGWSSNDVLKLKEHYATLWRLGKPFEIVLINCLSRNEVKQRFIKDLRGCPWLAIPFYDKTTYKKLTLELQSSEQLHEHLVIIPPDGKPFDIYGLSILHHGPELYPFTRETLIEREVARFKSLKLDSVLFSGNNKYVVDKQGHKIPASNLVGKNILLFLTTSTYDYDSYPLLNKVRSWYDAIKKQDESFEMIHVSRHKKERNDWSNPFTLIPCRKNTDPVGDLISRKIPGLKFPFDTVYNESLFENLLSCDLLPNRHYLTEHPMFVAFGRDGRFITRTNLYNLLRDEVVSCGEDTPNFFDDGNLFREIDEDIAYHNEWPPKDDTKGCFTPH